MGRLPGLFPRWPGAGFRQLRQDRPALGRGYGPGRTALRGHSGWVFAVAIVPYGETLATASEDMTVKLWDVASARELATFKGHTSHVLGVTFSPDSGTLATASRDMTVRLWPLSRRPVPTSHG